MTTKKPIGKASLEQSVVATPSPEEVLARYMDAVKALDLMRQQLEASGIKLEVPPAEPAMVRDTTVVVPSPEALAAKKALPEVQLPPVEVLNKVKPGAAIEGTYKPWTKMDIQDQDKFPLVPQLIPGAVHPIRDENGKFHIFMDVNGLQCSLLVHEYQEVSGMFYWAYKNIEDQWKLTEEYKSKGPVNAPWRDLQGKSTWSYQAEAPSAWLNIDGHYYKPGDEMPGEEIA